VRSNLDYLPFSIGLVAGGVTGAGPVPGLGAVADGVGLLAAGGGSSVQPATKTSESATLDSTDKLVIPRLIVTDALLVTHAMQPPVSVSVSQSTWCWVVGTTYTT
jgi:hypothetical protein